MSVHVIDVIRDGQTEDHLHLCSGMCQANALVILGATRDSGAGIQTVDGSELSYGAHPGGCETDYDVWCAACGGFLWHGLECECANKDTDREAIDVKPGELLD